MNYITNSFSVFTADEQIFEKILLGAAMLLGSVLIIPAFIFYGYLLKILRESETQNTTELPEWDNWGKLLTDGIIFYFLPALIFIPLLFLPLLGIAPAAILETTFEIGSLYLLFEGLMFISLLLYMYIVSGVMTLYAREGFSGLTNLSKIKQFTFSLEYFLAMLSVLGIYVAAMTIILTIILITFGFGLLLIPFIIPPLSYVSMLIIGNAVTEATNNTSSNTPEETQYDVEY